jgi:L-ascorbate metabolism protein UlaG (beta-lactamase superfamily)
VAETTLTYFGGPAFLLQDTSGTRVMIDPYLDEEVGSPIRTADLPDFNVLALTHGGRTHVGDTIDLLKCRPDVKLICGPEVKAWAEAEGIEPSRIVMTVWGVVQEVCGVRIRCVEAHHISQMRGTDGAFLSGLSHGYILTLSCGVSVYHLGDTSIFSDLKLIGELYRPTVGLVPVGKGTRDFFAELDPHEAAIACSWLRFTAVVPMHYLPGSEDPRRFVTELDARAPGTTALVLQPGETVALSQYVSSQCATTAEGKDGREDTGGPP